MKESELDRIIGEWYHRWVKYGYYGDPEKLDQDTEFQQAKAQVKALLTELIGEDEDSRWSKTYEEHLNVPYFRDEVQARIHYGGRNDLRADLRRKMEAL